MQFNTEQVVLVKAVKQHMLMHLVRVQIQSEEDLTHALTQNKGGLCTF